MKINKIIASFFSIAIILLVLVFQFLFHKVGLEYWCITEIAVKFDRAVIATVAMILCGAGIFVCRIIKNKKKD